MGLESIRFEQMGDHLRLVYQRNQEEKTLDFAIGRELETVFPEKYSGTRLFDESRFMQYRCSAIGTWLTSHKLFIRIWAEDLYVGNMTMCFGFRDDGKIGVKMQKNAQFYFDDFNGFAGGQAESF